MVTRLQRLAAGMVTRQANPRNLMMNKPRSLLLDTHQAEASNVLYGRPQANYADGAVPQLPVPRLEFIDTDTDELRIRITNHAGENGGEIVITDLTLDVLDDAETTLVIGGTGTTTLTITATGSTSEDGGEFVVVDLKVDTVDIVTTPIALGASINASAIATAIAAGLNGKKDAGEAITVSASAVDAVVSLTATGGGSGNLFTAGVTASYTTTAITTVEVDVDPITIEADATPEEIATAVAADLDALEDDDTTVVLATTADENNVYVTATGGISLVFNAGVAGVYTENTP